MKLLAAILTSSNIELLKRAYDSVKMQAPTKELKYDIWIVVNTLNKTYLQDVVNEFKMNNNVFIIETESNGTPGKGHNSCIDLFKREEKYEWLSILDGDDAYYPTAFQRFEIYIKRLNSDVFHLICNDKIRLNTRLDSNVCKWKLKNNFIMTGNFKNESRKLWERNKSLLKNPFHNKITDSATPSRLILLKRTIFDSKIPLRYSDNLSIFDDMVAFLCVLETQAAGELKTMAITDPNIYCYNMLNDESVSKTKDKEKLKNEEIVFRKEAEKFNVAKKYELMKLPIYENSTSLTKEINFSFNDKINFVNRMMIDRQLIIWRSEIIRLSRLLLFHEPIALIRKLCRLYELLHDSGIVSKEIIEKIVYFKKKCNEPYSKYSLEYHDRWGFDMDLYINHLYKIKKQKRNIFELDTKRKVMVIQIQRYHAKEIMEYFSLFKFKYNLVFLFPGDDIQVESGTTSLSIRFLIDIQDNYTIDTFIFTDFVDSNIYHIDLIEVRNVIFFPFNVSFKSKEQIYRFRNFYSKIKRLVFVNPFHEYLFLKKTFTDKKKIKNISVIPFPNQNEKEKEGQMRNTRVFVNRFSMFSSFDFMFRMMKGLKILKPEIEWKVFLDKSIINSSLQTIKKENRWITFNDNMEDYELELSKTIYYIHYPIMKLDDFVQKELIMAQNLDCIIFAPKRNSIELLVNESCFLIDLNSVFARKVSNHIENIEENNQIQLYSKLVVMTNHSVDEEHVLNQWASFLEVC